MKITLQGLIKAHLVKVCQAKTQLMRDRVEVKPKKQFTKKNIEEAVVAFRKHASSEFVDAMMNGLAILLDAPELSRTVFPLEQFGVVVLEKANSGQPYGVNTPCIVTNHTGGTGNRLFYKDGRVDCGCTFAMSDEPRPATEAEVRDCINNLNDQQWAVIMNHGSIFAPIVAEAMVTEVEVVEDESQNGEPADGSEIETNGRRITMATKE